MFIVELNAFLFEQNGYDVYYLRYLTNCIRRFANLTKDATANKPPNDRTIVGTIESFISLGLCPWFSFFSFCFCQCRSQVGSIFRQLSSGFISYKSSAFNGFFQPFQITLSNHAKNSLLANVAFTSGERFSAWSGRQCSMKWFFLLPATNDKSYFMSCLSNLASL